MQGSRASCLRTRGRFLLTCIDVHWNMSVLRVRVKGVFVSILMKNALLLEATGLSAGERFFLTLTLRCVGGVTRYVPCLRVCIANPDMYGRAARRRVLTDCVVDNGSTRRFFSLFLCLMTLLMDWMGASSSFAACRYIDR